MTPGSVKQVIIAGGGTAGWMTAAALAKAFNGNGIAVTLVESDEIGTVGVGEATIPSIHYFNSLLGIDQAEFMRECRATFKLGIEFVGWGTADARYIHPFTPFGRELNNVFFHELWLRYAKLKAQGGEVTDIDDYNLCAVAARKGVFSHPVSGVRLPVSPLNYAFHFDASLYAGFLRKFSETRGVHRIEGKIGRVVQDPETGFINGLVLGDGRQINGDFFVDCTGLRGLLIEQTMHAGYDDWRNWLPCDRAIAVPCESVESAIPYTRSTADSAGWRWRIPLQHRVGNGYVYSSAFLDDASAEDRLLSTLDGKASAPPRRIPFTPGKRKSFWVKNCVAVGLASGFMEPLESTSIHLIQTAVLKILAFFPDKAFEPADIATFNRHTTAEYERLRDFLVLHYKLTARGDTEFWRHCQNMEVPDAVTEAITLFSSRGRMMISADHLFSAHSWLSVMLGQGLRPRGHDPLADAIPQSVLGEHMDGLRTYIDQATARMPRHQDYISQFGGAAKHG